MVQAIPDGSEGAVPYICCKGAAQAIDFYVRAFGARELLRIGDENIVGHAELTIGKARFALADEHPELGFLSPKTIGGTPFMIQVYVENVDALAAQAERAGAIIRRPVEDKFYGDRSVLLEDPFGHVWAFSTHIEDVSEEEMQRRAAADQK